MKRLTLLFSGWIICCVICQAQSFRYDTIPANQVKTRQTFRYDTIPANQINSRQSFRYDTIRTNNYSGNQTRTSTNHSSFEQSSPSKFKKENLVLGGSFGIYFGTYTSLNISPQVGYRFSKSFTAGLGIGYSYYKEDYDYGYKDWTQNYLGGNIYMQFNPFQYIRLQVQPELYGFWGSYQPDTKMVPCILIGGGLTMPMGNRSGVSMMIYYDVLQDDYSPYGNQIIYSVGYSIGF